MKRDANDIVLSYTTRKGIAVRTISVIFFALVLFCISYIIFVIAEGKYMINECMNIIEIIGRIVSPFLPFLLIMAFVSLCFSFRDIAANDKTISTYLLGKKVAAVAWEDINEVKMEKISGFSPYSFCYSIYLQRDMLCLYANNDREIKIPIDIKRFEEFYILLKAHISDAPEIPTYNN